MFKTAWQLLMSPFVAVVWVVMAVLLYIGWGPKQVDRFCKAWADMLDMEDGEGTEPGPVTGGPLPPDPVEEEVPARKSGEGIG